MRILAMILAMLLIPAAIAGAQALDITLSGTLELNVEDMGVEMDWFTDPAMAAVEPVWTESGVLTLKDNGYSAVTCLGCELQLKDDVWSFPVTIDVKAEHFADGYGVTVYFGEGQEWYYEDGMLVYGRVDTKDGGRVTYAPGGNVIQAAFVHGSQIITGQFSLTGELTRYYVEYFEDDVIATACYSAAAELTQFSVTDRATGTEYAFGGAKGWFVSGENGYESSAAPEGFEEYTVEMVMEEYPPVEYGPAIKLGGNKTSLSGSTVGSMGFKLGDTLTLTSGSVVKQLKMNVDAAVAPLVTEAGVILKEGSFVELLVLEGEAALFNPDWISFDETSGVKEVQLPTGETVGYDEFLDSLK